MRDKKIDCIKALMIILVVIGHSGFRYSSVISLFHMPVFFMVSGYLVTFCSDGSVKQLVAYCLRKIKTIWLPYFIWNLIFTICNNTFINLNIYSSENIVFENSLIQSHSYMSVASMVKNIIKGVFMLGRTELGGAFWFLRTLFYVAVLFAIIDFTLRKVLKSQGIIQLAHGIFAIICLGIGYGANLIGVKSLAIPVIFSAYFVYYLGYVFKKTGMIDKINYIYSLIGVVILGVASKGPGISFGNNQYGEPIYLILCTLAGWCVCVCVGGFLSGTRVVKWAQYIGERTLCIVILHFVAFKLVSGLQILLYDYPISYLASFPVLNGHGIWWIVYTVVGVVIPLIMEEGYQIVKKRIQRMPPV